MPLSSTPTKILAPNIRSCNNRNNPPLSSTPTKFLAPDIRSLSNESILMQQTLILCNNYGYYYAVFTPI